MNLVDDHGRAMDAEYLGKTDGDHLALIMERRSGMSGGQVPRNPDYNRTLTFLLARLGMLNAVLVDALVDLRHTQDLGLPEPDRRLIQAPIRLALEPDADALRRRLGSAQAKIAQAPDATKGGNSTKRIRLRVDVPGSCPATPTAWRKLSLRPPLWAPRRGPVTARSAQLARTCGWR